MPLINNDKLGRLIVRIGYVAAIVGVALAILTTLGLIIAVTLFR